jgi:Secretion system C-terminal sorting domain
MKKIIIMFLLTIGFESFCQNVDSGVGAMDIADLNNISLQANSLVAGSTVFVKIPIQNLNESNTVKNGTITIKLGDALSPETSYSLSSAPLSNYFNWTFNSSTKTITGTIVNAFPADQYGINAVFKLNVGTTGGGTVESVFAASSDENPINNKSTLVYSIVASPLPVDLLSFSGKKISKQTNKLTWTTAKEKDFNYFEIQKSFDAKSFEGIGQQKGISKQNTYLQSFEFIDNEVVKAINYYRLKMVDLDGSYKYSNIISLQNEIDVSIIGEFYPNPAETYTQIDIIAQTDGKWKLTATDLNGRVIKTYYENLKKGGNRLNLDITNWIAGLTIVTFENSNEGKVESRKVLKK